MIQKEDKNTSSWANTLLSLESKNVTTTTRTATTSDDTKRRILVAFTGPSGVPAKHQGKQELYERNLDHFLAYGVQCHDRDTIITVGHEFYDTYYNKVKAIHDTKCRGTGHFVHLVARRSVCYDMETVRLLVTGSIAGVNWNEYDYFVHINCGVTGPHPNFRDTWLDIYLSRLEGSVHMTGLSLLCHGDRTHIQSMMYAVDRIGMSIVATRVYDCLDEKANDGKSFINTYERGMGIELLKQGYALSPATLQSAVVVTRANASQCNHTKDMWITKHLTPMYGGRMPSLEETIFWKTSRILTPEIKAMIGHQGPHSNW